MLFNTVNSLEQCGQQNIVYNTVLINLEQVVHFLLCRRKTKSGSLACEDVTIKTLMLIQIIQVDAPVDWVNPICQGKFYSD